MVAARAGQLGVVQNASRQTAQHLEETLTDRERELEVSHDRLGANGEREDSPNLATVKRGRLSDTRHFCADAAAR